MFTDGVGTPDPETPSGPVRRYIYIYIYIYVYVYTYACVYIYIYIHTYIYIYIYIVLQFYTVSREGLRADARLAIAVPVGKKRTTLPPDGAPSGVIRLNLERYGEDERGPCARMTRTNRHPQTICLLLICSSLFPLRVHVCCVRASAPCSD